MKRNLLKGLNYKWKSLQNNSNNIGILSTPFCGNYSRKPRSLNKSYIFKKKQKIKC